MKKIATAALCALLASTALAACGSGGGDTSATAPTATATTAAQPPAHSRPGDSSGGEGAGGAGGGSSGPDAAPGRGAGKGNGQGGGKGKSGKSGAVPGDTSASFTPPTHHDSASAAASFETKGGDNSIQEFGAEAAGADFEAAAAALHSYLDARTAAAWTAACSYMAAGTTASLAQLSGGEGGKTSCPEVLASLSGGLPPSSLREAAVADAGALRLEGERAFLLFQGAHHTDYFMPMAREGGAWKVAAIAPSAIS